MKTIKPHDFAQLPQNTQMVFDSIPLKEAAPLVRVHAELIRQGHRMDMRILQGILRALTERGWVKFNRKEMAYTKVAKLMAAKSKAANDVQTPEPEEVLTAEQQFFAGLEQIRDGIHKVEEAYTELLEERAKDEEKLRLLDSLKGLLN